jgi:hypothetical protein
MLENGVMYIYSALWFDVIDASTKYTNIYHEWNRLFITLSLSLSNAPVIEQFSSIACNSTIASNK